MKNAQLKFNEEKHEYKLGGIIVPSVSQILQANGLFESFRHNENKLKIGTYIHKALELSDKGTLDTTNLDPRLKKCIDLWEKFKKDSGLKIIEVEKKVNVGVMYAGTIDRVAKGMYKKSIIDFKSGVPQDWAALQTAGYAMAYDPTDYMNYERYCLRIHWDLDRAVYKPYKDQQDFNTFMAMATTYHWKKNHGYLRQEDDDGDNGNGVTDTEF